MTKEEASKKTEEKVDKIKALCKELQITLSPEEIITENNIIRKVVYFVDSEKYDVEIPKTTDTEIKA